MKKGHLKAISIVIMGSAIGFIANIFAASSSIDTSFDTGTPLGFNAEVTAITKQSDGKLLVGGRFTTYQGILANHLIRLNTDGTKDNSLNIGSGFGGGTTYQGGQLHDGEVSISAIAVQGDGKIIVGGKFLQYRGVRKPYLVRLNANGSIDSTFNIGTGLNGGVTSVLVQANGKIVVGGEFDAYGLGCSDPLFGSEETCLYYGKKWDSSKNAKFILRLNPDGSRDTTFRSGTGFDNIVYKLVPQSDGKILVAGAFLTYKGEDNRTLIRLNADGSKDSSFSISGVDFGEVRSIGLQNNGKIIIGGHFSVDGGHSKEIVRLNNNGSLDSSFDEGALFTNGDSLLSVAVQSNGKIIVGGQFSIYIPGFCSIPGERNPEDQRSCESNGGIYTPRHAQDNIIRLNTDGSKDNSFDAGEGINNYGVKIVQILDGDKILLGGDFSTYNNHGASNIAPLNANGTFDTTFNAGNGLNGGIKTIAIQEDHKILIGGMFSSYKGISINKLARINIDGTLDSSFNIGKGFDQNGSEVRDILIQSGGKIFVGGVFSEFSGHSVSPIARLHNDGSLDTGFISPIGVGMGTVYALEGQDDGKILVGGDFSVTYNGKTQKGIVRLNSNGSLDTGFNAGPGTGFNPGYSSVLSLKVDDDDKILVGGNFSTYNGVAANKLIRLNPDGSRDGSFVGHAINGQVYDIAIQDDGQILIAGNFSVYGADPVWHMGRLNTNGTLDKSFTLTMGSDWISNIQQIGNKIVIGGSFSKQYMGTTSEHIVALNMDGTKDTEFDFGAGLNDSVSALAVDNGKLFVGGMFTRYNGSAIGYLMSVYGDISAVLLPNTTDAGIISSAFTSKGYIESDGIFEGSTPISLNETNGEILKALKISNQNILISIPAGVQLKDSDTQINYNDIIAVPISKPIDSVNGQKVVVSFNVGSVSQPLDLSGGMATLRVPTPTKAVGDPLQIYYSEDNGVTWQYQATTDVINYNNGAYVRFSTDHFTNFAITEYADFDAWVSYNTTMPTKRNVIATLNLQGGGTITNNNGGNSYIFTDNGSFSFEVRDPDGNIVSVPATVSWIDKESPEISGINNNEIYSETALVENIVDNYRVVASVLDDTILTGLSDLSIGKGEHTLITRDYAGNKTILDFYVDSIYGCTDSGAVNYNSGATIDDASCIFAGCTDSYATNYDANASVDNGSCTYVPGCTNPKATNYDENATQEDYSCTYSPLELNASNITEEPFNCATDATFCDLSNLNITDIAVDTFVNHPDLQELNLFGNHIGNLEPGAFSGLSSVFSIELGYNNLKKLLSGTFDGLPNLTSLSIYQNPISEIETGTFNGLDILQYIDAGNLKLTTLTPWVFEGLGSALTDLYLYEDYSLPGTIHTIETGAFDQLTGLVTLSLISNSIKNIPASIFDNLTQLLPDNALLDDNCINKALVFTNPAVQAIDWQSSQRDCETQTAGSNEDTLNPVIWGIADDTIYTGSISLTTVTDNVAVQKVNLDGQLLQDRTNITISEPGIHTLIATDTAGNSNVIFFQIGDEYFGQSTGGNTIPEEEETPSNTGTINTPIANGGGSSRSNPVKKALNPVKELFHQAPSVPGKIDNSPYSTEINNAYLRAYNMGITTKPTIQEANIEGKLYRSHLAKMLVSYATTVLNKTQTTGKPCHFTDMKDQTKELQTYATVACELGLMGIKADGTPDTTFSPTEEVSRAQFGTVLSRLLYSDSNNTDGKNYYEKHLQALKTSGIMNKIDNPDMKEIRGNVFLMLMRATK